MKNKLIILLTICLLILPTSTVYASELPLTNTEDEAICTQSCSEDTNDTDVEDETIYAQWHSEDANGNPLYPTAVNLDSGITEESFESQPETIIVENYKESGAVEVEEIPIETIERTVEGDFEHPGVNSVQENLVYNDTYQETIYHSVYTFVTVSYRDEETNEDISTWNWEVIGWSFKFSEEDDGIKAITEGMTDEEKDSFYSHYYSPHQDTRYGTWDVSDWDQKEIEGYKYSKTDGAVKGTFQDLTKQHNIIVYYLKNIIPVDPEPDDPDPEPEPEPKIEPEEPIVPTEPENPITPVPLEEPTYEPIIPQNNSNLTIYQTSAPIQKKSEPQVIEPASLTTIEEGEAPLVGSFKNIHVAPPTEKWALLNLIIALLTLALGIILLFVRQKKKEDDNEGAYKEDKKDIRNFKILSLFIGILAIIVFLFTEDITLEMQLIDKWTIIMLLLFIDQLFAALIIHKEAKGSKKDEQWRKQ